MYENQHNCIFMNIDEKSVLGNQQYKKEWVPTYKNAHIWAVSCFKDDSNCNQSNAWI